MVVVVVLGVEGGEEEEEEEEVVVAAAAAAAGKKRAKKRAIISGKSLGWSLPSAPSAPSSTSPSQSPVLADAVLALPLCCTRFATKRVRASRPVDARTAREPPPTHSPLSPPSSSVLTLSTIRDSLPNIARAIER